MTLAAGTKLGPYDIVSPLGAGGMGEVYRAKDTRLGREVAIKVLLASFAADAERLRRFEQEARATGALNHPNILAIYDVGTADGAPYLVSELLEGETLRKRMSESAVPLRKALEFGVQIANGLAAAHEKGIVHRDLKPENLFVTRDSRIKILDFGLAKLERPEPSGGATVTAATAAAREEVQTNPGAVLGTVGYMSPEQVRGLASDSRSDIFSFGTILYEMVSGERAFRAGSSVETMNAILKEDPPEISPTNRSVPAAVERVIRRCLEKSPEERFQSARDLGFALEALSGTSISSIAVEAPAIVREEPRRNWGAVIMAAIVLIALGVGAGWWLGRKSATNPQPAFHQLTFKRGLIYSARFAPDGKNVIYSASWESQPVQLYSTSPDSPESRPLDLKDSSLFSVSSTGELAVSLGCRFLFFGECVGTLARVSLSGGAPRKIAGDVVSADWTSDGSEIAVIRESGGKFQVEFPLGKVVYENAGWLIDLRVSPRGDAIAFTEHTVRGIDDGRVVVLDRSGKVKVRSEDFNSVEGVAWAAGGSEVWFSGTPQQGWAKEIHALNLEGKDRLILRLPGILRLHDVSSDGRVLLSKENWRTGILFRGPGMDGARDLSWHDGSEVTDISRDGKFVAFAESGEAGGQSFLVYLRGTDGSPAVNLGNGGDPALSPDGNWAAVTVFDANTDSRHIALLPTGAGQSKTLELGQIRSVAMPGWMPDGTQVIFAGYDGHGWRIYVQDINGGKMRAVTPEVRVEPELYQPTSVSPDGKYVFGRDPEGKPWLYPLDMSTPRPVPGIEPGDLWIGWPDDGKSGFVYPGGRVPVQLFRLDLTTGKRQLVTEIAPGDLSGLSDISSVRITPDGKAHAYSYDRCMSELYLVGGLK